MRTPDEIVEEILDALEDPERSPAQVAALVGVSVARVLEVKREHESAKPIASKPLRGARLSAARIEMKRDLAEDAARVLERNRHEMKRRR